MHDPPGAADRETEPWRPTIFWCRFRPKRPHPRWGAEPWTDSRTDCRRAGSEDARLLLSELVTNAVRHPALAPDEPISVAFRISDSELAVEVTSRVRGFDADAVDFSSDAGTGWGLLLLESLSDAWGSERKSDGSSVVWFRLRLGAG